MTKSEPPGNTDRPSPKSGGKEDRRVRAARALRENLKKRKQQLKAREKPEK